MKKSIFVFVFIVAILSPLTSAVVIGQDQSKKAQDHSKVEVCHITGTHDFSYKDGGDSVSIGHVIHVSDRAYKAHITHGDPEVWKDTTLPNGTEVCVESEIEGAQFENGVALFGHDTNTGRHFTTHLYPKMGADLAHDYYKNTQDKPWGYSYKTMTAFYLDGEQYVMGISNYINIGKGYHYFIQLILPSGDFGPITDAGYFKHFYSILIPLTRPSGKVFIYAQDDDNSNYFRSITHEVLHGGRLAASNADSTHRAYYYNATTPLPNNEHTCFYAQDSDDHNHWIIDCIFSDGEFFSSSSGHNHDWGTWDDGYQVALSYRAGDQSYLFAERHHTPFPYTHKYGDWFIKKISTNSYMGDETDSGEWHNWYQTMTIFKYPFNNRFYLIGHNTDKNWFIQHVTYAGTMGAEIDNGGPYDHYYEHFFPIAFDASYLHPDRWMGTLLSEIPDFGERKLREIAMPGSHDSGMNEDDTDDDYCEPPLLARSCNTVTHTRDIGQQLAEGARFFDIRPMIDTDESGSNDWTTGHADGVSWKGITVTAGCRGESKDSITDSLKDFYSNTAHSNELVILKVSHCITPPGIDYDTCTPSQLNKMANNLAEILQDHLVTCNPDTEDNCLNNMTLDEILTKGNIILVVQHARDTANGIFNWGYGSKSDYYNYDEYSNTMDYDVMVKGGNNNNDNHDNGQIAKLLNKDNHDPNKYTQFLLSWTLTLDTASALTCVPTILDMATSATKKLFGHMYLQSGLTKTLFPNILYADDFSRTVTNAAVYLNRLWDGLDP